jgi:site-specific DNA-cytosine methylase
MAHRRPRTSPPRATARTLSTPRSYGVLSLFCGLGGKTLGFLRARGAAGSRFHSVGAIDESELACRNFKLLTGETASALDIGLMEGPDLAEFCSRPDVVIMSPPCKGWSGCLPESMAKLERYQRLNRLALHSLKIVLDAWETPPALILFENVPRILSRGKKQLKRAITMLRKRGYEVDIRTHNCGVLGGLAQNRERVLIVARHSELAPSHLLKPDPKPVRAIGDVLWQLPVPIPGGSAGGPLHELPELAIINWVRLAAIRARRDWQDLPAEIRIGGPVNQHAGKYGVQDPGLPAHTVLGDLRTGKGWSEVADPRVVTSDGQQSGLYGVADPGAPGHAVLALARPGNSSWASVADPRLGCEPHGGTMGVADPARPSVTILGVGKIHNMVASVADMRLGDRSDRQNGGFGVNALDAPAHAVLGEGTVRNTFASVIDPRVTTQHRGNFGVEDPSDPSSCVRGTHVVRTAQASVADGRLFEPTHRLVAGQPLTVARELWVAGSFELLGPELDLAPGGRPCWLVIEAPDGCFHRPMTDLELAMLQGIPVWHRPGDPTELAIGAEGGQWLVLKGNKKQRREQIGNAVPPATAQAIAERVLELLDAGAESIFRLSAAGIWVDQADRHHHRHWSSHAIRNETVEAASGHGVARRPPRFYRSRRRHHAHRWTAESQRAHECLRRTSLAPGSWRHRAHRRQLPAALASRRGPR